MGISATSAGLLLDCRRAGVDFGRTVMLGRQNLYLSGPEFAGLIRSAGMESIPGLAGAVQRSGDYAEPFFRALGARQVDSMDASDFEGATLIHDLNQPVPASWCEAFDFVYDGGTLEHVFDFPAALANAMRMTRTGGRLVLHTPSNNLMGHGLYQFSPELFFRVLGPANGFEMVRVVVVEAGVSMRLYEAVDPMTAGIRGELANRVPVWLHVEARKIGPTPERLSSVQQSDYQARWGAHGAAPEKVQHLTDPNHWVPPGLRQFLLESFPGLTRRLERLVGIYLSPRQSLRNRAAYRRLRL